MPNFLCKRCNKSAMMACDRCLDPYCSLKCQQLDWPVHKSACFKIPALIPMPKVFLDAEANNYVCDNNLEQLAHIDRTKPKIEEGNGLESKVVPLAWKKCFPYLIDKYIDVITLAVEDSMTDDVVVWVSEVKYSDKYFNFLDELNDTYVFKKCDPETLKIGQLVAVHMKEIYHRAEIIGFESDSTGIQIRIIDVGKKLFVSRDLLFNAVPKMVQTPSFAFMVCVPKKCGPYEMETPITICVTDKMFRKGVPFAKIQQNLEFIKERVEYECSSLIAEVKVISGSENNMKGEFPLIERVQTRKEENSPIASRNDVDNIDKNQSDIILSRDTRKNSLENIQHREIDHKVIDKSEGKLNMDEPQTKRVNISFFTFKDLKVVGIRTGKNVPVLVLDASNLQNGYVTAADFSNTEFLKKLETNLASVHEYGLQVHTKTKYRPKNEELCLAIFDEDGLWYRAICIDKIDTDIFVVMFMDYGNITKVKAENLLPMTNKLMFASNANMCYIKNLNKQLYDSFKKAVIEHPIFKCDVENVKNEDDTYTITLSESELKRLV